VVELLLNHSFHNLQFWQNAEETNKAWLLYMASPTCMKARYDHITMQP
jgi:hypothetical protein